MSARRILTRRTANARHDRHAALFALWPRLGAECPKPADVREVSLPLLGQAAEAREESEDRMTCVNPMETPEYWESLARSERAFAADDRRRRGGTSESIRLHLANAVDYEQRALVIRQATKARTA